MKIVNRARLVTTLMVGALLGLGSMAANAAANTPANTPIANKATVSYNVGAVTQTPVESSPTGNSNPGAGNGTPTTFVVDAKLVFTVTTVDAAIVSVTPGQTGAVLVYQVTNTGNDTQGVSFTTLAEATGTVNPFATQPADNFDTTGVNIYVSASNSATYVPANDTASTISQLAPGASRYVFVVSTIPVARVNGDSAVMALVAQVATAGATAGYAVAPGANITSDDHLAAWTPGTVQHIFADAAGTDDLALDGKASSRDAYLVKSASLTISKTSKVVSDPTGAATPHAIPGAVMQYTITVANAAGASANASSIAINDSLASILTNVTWNANSLAVASTGAGNANGTCADSGTTLTATSPYTAVTCGYSSSTVSVTGITLQPGNTASITFNVTIQ
ncbi:MAG: hypothetical protein ABI227_10190 [Rhodanobacter sp.]